MRPSRKNLRVLGERSPFEVAVRPRDVSISARCDVNDHFSLVRHEYQFLLRRRLSVEALVAV